MKKISFLKKETQEIIISECTVASTFFTRLKGLLGHSHLKITEGLLLEPCHEIHMWGMRFAIDVIFLKKISFNEYHISSLYPRVLPGTFWPVRDSHAWSTLEVSQGIIDLFSLCTGECLITHERYV